MQMLWAVRYFALVCLVMWAESGLVKGALGFNDRTHSTIHFAVFYK